MSPCDCKKKKSYIALFSQLHSHPVCFSHLNPLWAGGRLAAGAGLLLMLAYMLNKAVAADSGWCRILSFFLLRPAANRHWCLASATCKKKKKKILLQSCLAPNAILTRKQTAAANTHAQIHTFHTTSPYTSLPPLPHLFSTVPSMAGLDC